MGTGSSNGSIATPATKVLIRVGVYYIIIVALGILAWRYLPRTHLISDDSLNVLFGAATETVRGTGKNMVVQATATGGTLAASVALAMLAAFAVALPVAWIYTLTRSKRGYQQSVVQLLIILPVVVAGIVVMVKYSIALAFSLGGIAAAVRFRNSLDDSKDAVYVFLATAVGLASAVNLPVAAVVSIAFNTIALVLWYTDFGSAPVELDGRIADQRLKRARQLARTGTFVARIDDEVFRNMTREQLEGVAQRAWKRAQAQETDAGDEAPQEVRVRIRTNDLAAMRRAVDPRLTENVKNWRIGAIGDNEGVQTAEYHVQLKKKASPDDLLALLRASGSDQVLTVELL